MSVKSWFRRALGIADSVETKKSDSPTVSTSERNDDSSFGGTGDAAAQFNARYSPMAYGSYTSAAVDLYNIGNSIYNNVQNRKYRDYQREQDELNRDFNERELAESIRQYETNLAFQESEVARNQANYEYDRAQAQSNWENEFYNGVSARVADLDKNGLNPLAFFGSSSGSSGSFSSSSVSGPSGSVSGSATQSGVTPLEANPIFLQSLEYKQQRDLQENQITSQEKIASENAKVSQQVADSQENLTSAQADTQRQQQDLIVLQQEEQRQKNRIAKQEADYYNELGVPPSVSPKTKDAAGLPGLIKNVGGKVKESVKELASQAQESDYNNSYSYYLDALSKGKKYQKPRYPAQVRAFNDAKSEVSKRSKKGLDALNKSRSAWNSR